MIGKTEIKLYLGTSGYSYYHWKGLFYPEGVPSKEFLSFYSRHFNSVEINSTFYRLPKEETLKTWKKSVPSDFAFVLKAPKTITHLKRLKEADEEVEKFIILANMLEENLSCILWQFPPSFVPQPDLLKDFFERLVGLRSDVRHAVEFRNSKSFDEEILKVLKELNICLVCAHSGRYPCLLERTANFSYFRFHGPGSLYNSRYSEDELDMWAKKILDSLKYGDVYVFFNNDFSGFAVENASYLKRKLEGV